MKEEYDYEEKKAFLFEVLKRYDHYIGTTNFKIGLLMSFLGAVIIGLATTITSNIPENEPSDIYYLFVAFSFFTITLSLIASFFLLKVVFPNTSTTTESESLIFFGDVAKTKNNGRDYSEKVKQASTSDLFEDLSIQVYVVATITDEKFRILKKGVRIINFFVIPSLGVSIFFLIINERFC